MWKISLIIRITIMFDDSLNITAVIFFIADFNSLSCGFDKLAFTLLYLVTLH